MTLQRQLPALLLLALTIAIGGCLTSDDLASGPEDTAGAPGPNGGGNGATTAVTTTIREIPMIPETHRMTTAGQAAMAMTLHLPRMTMTTMVAMSGLGTTMMGPPVTMTMAHPAMTVMPERRRMTVARPSRDRSPRAAKSRQSHWPQTAHRPERRYTV